MEENIMITDNVSSNMLEGINGLMPERMSPSDVMLVLASIFFSFELGEEDVEHFFSESGLEVTKQYLRGFYNAREDGAIVTTRHEDVH